MIQDTTLCPSLNKLNDNKFNVNSYNREIYKELDDKKDNSNLSFDGISINTQGQKPNLKNKQLFNYPVTTVIDVDIGKGKETIRIVQPFFDHPIFGSWLYSLPIKNIEKFDDIKPSDYRKVSLIISVITGFSIFLFLSSIASLINSATDASG